MTTRITVDVPLQSTYQAEVETQSVPRGPHDDGIRRDVVKPGDSLSFYIYGSISVKAIREVPLVREVE